MNASRAPVDQRRLGASHGALEHLAQNLFWQLHQPKGSKSTILPMVLSAG